MAVLDRYVLVEWLKALGLTLGALVGILVLQDATNHAGDFRAEGASPGALLEYYAWLVPGYLPWLLPIALFLSTLLTLATLRRNHEITALRACGVSAARFARTLPAVGLLASFLTYGLNASWSPQATEKARELREAMTGGAAKERVVHNFEMKAPGNPRRWFFREFRPDANLGEGVHLYVRSPAGGDSFRVRAEEAFRDEEGTWTFLRGRFLGFASERGTPRPGPFGEGVAWDANLSTSAFPGASSSLTPTLDKAFDRLRLSFLGEEPAPFLLAAKKPSELSVRELDRILEALPSKDDAVARPFALRKAHAVWTAPACLLAVILGIPFALIGERRSAAGGVVRAGGLFLAYYVARTAADSLGEAGVLSVEWAAGAPMLLLGGVACGALWRAR